MDNYNNYNNRNNPNKEKTIEDIFKLYNPIDENNLNINNGLNNKKPNNNNINNNPNPMNSNIPYNQNNLDKSNNYNMNISSNLDINTYEKVQPNNKYKNNTQQNSMFPNMNRVKKEDKNSLNNIRVNQAEYIDYEALNKTRKKTMLFLGLLQVFLFPIGLILTIINKSLEKKHKIYLTSAIFSGLLIFSVIFTPIIINFYKDIASSNISYNVNNDCAKLNNYIFVYKLNMDKLKPEELVIDTTNTIDKVYYVKRSPYTYKIVMNKQDKLVSIIKIDSFGKTSLIIY